MGGADTPEKVAQVPPRFGRTPATIASSRWAESVTSAPADTQASAQAAAPVAADDSALNAVVSLGLHTVLALPGVTATVRRWRYRGHPRVEFVIVGVPTDQAGSELRDRLLRLRAHVLYEFVTRGMHVFSTERNHDPAHPRMSLVDRLK